MLDKATVLPPSCCHQSHQIVQPASGLGSDEPIWYFAYGSNMSRQKFVHDRGIVPMAAARAQIPGWCLTMEVPGLPYSEPGMSSIAPVAAHSELHSRRNPHNLNDTSGGDGVVKRSITWPFSTTSSTTNSSLPENERDVIGVAYRVTRRQFISIIASEGGGIAYDAVELEAQAVSDRDRAIFGSRVITVCTLVNVPFMSRRDREPRPSERYKGLLVTGAAESDLPQDYQQYLRNWPAFEKPSRRMWRRMKRRTRQSRPRLPSCKSNCDRCEGECGMKSLGRPYKEYGYDYDDNNHNDNVDVDHDNSEDEDKDDDDDLKRWIGALMFLAIFTPLLAGMERLTKTTIRADDGLVPRWVKWVVQSAVWVIWWSHDVGFSPLFGRGDGREDLDQKRSIEVAKLALGSISEKGSIVDGTSRLCESAGIDSSNGNKSPTLFWA